MDTLLILRDTITANVVKVTDSCSHCVQEAATNWPDVTIVFCICVTIIVIATYGTSQFIKNKAKVREYKCKDDLLNKYLEFLKDQTQEGQNKPNSNLYRQVLEHLIELSQQNKINTFTKDKLYQDIENNPYEETEKPSSKN